MANICTNIWKIYCQSEAEYKEILELMTEESDIEKTGLRREVTFAKLVPEPEIYDRVRARGCPTFKDDDPFENVTILDDTITADEEIDERYLERPLTDEEKSEIIEDWRD